MTLNIIINLKMNMAQNLIHYQIFKIKVANLFKIKITIV